MTALAPHTQPETPDADRHPTLSVLCGHVDRVIGGSHAAHAAASPDGLPAHAVCWRPPAFGWMYAAIKVGRKERSRVDGSRLRLPVRLVWDAPVVLLADHQTTRQIAWSTTSMGHDTSGVTTVVVDPAALSVKVESGPDGIPTRVMLPCDPVDPVAWLRQLEADAHAGTWDFLQMLEPDVSQALHRAHASLSRAVAEFTGSEGPVLDDVRLEGVLTRMMYGEGNHPGKVRQILARLCDPVTLNSVDPWKYITVALTRDSKEVLRQEIGDPRIGAKVREAARTLDCADIDSFVAAFREMYPSAGLENKRAIAALSVAADPMATAIRIDSTENSALSDRAERPGSGGTPEPGYEPSYEHAGHLHEVVE